jgi:hypothetical protein
MANKSKMETPCRNGCRTALRAKHMTWEARTPSSETRPMPVGAPYR